MSLPLDLLMFAALIIFILIGYPVAFTISGVATAFALIGWLTGDFTLGLMGALGQRFFAVLTNPVLTAIPLFVLMGVVLEKSRIAEDLLETMGRLFGPMRGGLGVSVILVGALLAASTGIQMRAASLQPSANVMKVFGVSRTLRGNVWMVFMRAFGCRGGLAVTVAGAARCECRPGLADAAAVAVRLRLRYT